MQQILKMPSHFSSHLDYSLLKPTATIEAVEKLCKEAMENNYAAVCVPPLFVKKAKEFTEGSNVKVAAYGNVLSATALLQGITIEELTTEELLFQDNDYQVVITIVATKPLNA